jgi:hypothetical protein
MSDRNDTRGHEPDIEVVDYLYGEMTPERRAAFERRLQEEPALRAEVARFQALKTRLDGLPGIEPPPELVERVIAEAHAACRKREQAEVGWLERLAESFRWLLKPQAGVALAAMLVVAVGIYMAREAKQPSKPGTPEQAREEMRPLPEKSSAPAVVGEPEPAVVGEPEPAVVGEPEPAEEAPGMAVAPAMPGQQAVGQKTEQAAADSTVGAQVSDDRARGKDARSGDFVPASAAPPEASAEAPAAKDASSALAAAPSVPSGGAAAGSEPGLLADSVMPLAGNVAGRTGGLTPTADKGKADSGGAGSGGVSAGPDTGAVRRETGYRTQSQVDAATSSDSLQKFVEDAKKADQGDGDQALTRENQDYYKRTTESDRPVVVDGVRWDEKARPAAEETEKAPARVTTETKPVVMGGEDSAVTVTAVAKPTETALPVSRDEEAEALSSPKSKKQTGLFSFGDDAEEGAAPVSQVSGGGKQPVAVVSGAEKTPTAQPSVDESPVLVESRYGEANRKEAAGEAPELDATKQEEGWFEEVAAKSEEENAAQKEAAKAEKPEAARAAEKNVAKAEEPVAVKAEEKKLAKAEEPVAVKKVVAQKAAEDVEAKAEEKKGAEATATPAKEDKTDCAATWDKLLALEKAGKNADALTLLEKFRTGDCAGYLSSETIGFKEADLLLASGQKDRARTVLRRMKQSSPPAEQKAVDIMLESIEK